MLSSLLDCSDPQHNSLTRITDMDHPELRQITRVGYFLTWHHHWNELFHKIFLLGLIIEANSSIAPTQILQLSFNVCTHKGFASIFLDIIYKLVVWWCLSRAGICLNLGKRNCCALLFYTLLSLQNFFPVLRTFLQSESCKN